MKKLELTKSPVAIAEMLIRKPIAEVFDAFINPAITTKFWFTDSSGRIEQGKKITWKWSMYNITAEIEVKIVDKNKRIELEWEYNGVLTPVEFIFTPLGNDSTFVSIKNSGFGGDGDKISSDALSSKGGFTWVLAGLKAYLEHGIELNLIGDAYPKELREH